MEIYIKIGTLPAALMHLCRKRIEPKLGDHVYVKADNKRYIKAESVVIDQVKDVAGSKLFYAERI